MGSNKRISYKLSIDYGFEITNNNRISTSSLRSGVMPCLGAHFFATNLLEVPSLALSIPWPERDFFIQRSTNAGI